MAQLEIIFVGRVDREGRGTGEKWVGGKRGWGIVEEGAGNGEKGAGKMSLFVLRLNVPVNNFSVMSGRSHHFLGN